LIACAMKKKKKKKKKTDDDDDDLWRNWTLQINIVS
jgi:hypothetical protein